MMAKQWIIMGRRRSSVSICGFCFLVVCCFDSSLLLSLGL